MTVEEKYPLLIGHSLAGRTRLHNIQEVANFICTHGQYVALTNKNRNFDTVGIKVAVLSFCLKALISRSFWLLRCLLLASRTIAHRQSSPQRYWMAVGYCLFL